jgi:hypothetical protein
MKTKLISAVAGAALLAVAGVANAEEPVRLSDAAMDSVSAGAFAVDTQIAAALGGALAVTASVSNTTVVPGWALAFGSATGLAGSTVGPAASASSSTSAAGL